MFSTPSSKNNDIQLNYSLLNFITFYFTSRIKYNNPKTNRRLRISTLKIIQQNTK